MTLFIDKLSYSYYKILYVVDRLVSNDQQAPQEKDFQSIFLEKFFVNN